MLDLSHQIEMQTDHYKNDDSNDEDNSAEKLKCVSLQSMKCCGLWHP